MCGLPVIALGSEPSGLQAEKLALSQYSPGRDALACVTKCHSAQLQVPGCFRKNDSSGSGAVVLRSDARPRELAGPHSDIPSISFILGPSSSCASFRGSNRGRMGGHRGTLCAPGPASGPTLPGRRPSLSSYQHPANSRLHPHRWDRANSPDLEPSRWETGALSMYLRPCRPQGGSNCSLEPSGGRVA